MTIENKIEKLANSVIGLTDAIIKLAESKPNKDITEPIKNLLDNISKELKSSNAPEKEPRKPKLTKEEKDAKFVADVNAIMNPLNTKPTDIKKEFEKLANVKLETIKPEPVKTEPEETELDVSKAHVITKGFNEVIMYLFDSGTLLSADKKIIYKDGKLYRDVTYEQVSSLASYKKAYTKSGITSEIVKGELAKLGFNRLSDTPQNIRNQIFEFVINYNDNTEYDENDDDI